MPAILTFGCHGKTVMHWVWAYGEARLACTRAVFHILAQRHGFQPHASGFVPLSIAKLNL